MPIQVNLPTTAFTLGAPYYSFRDALPDERKWQIGDTASMLFGKHNLKYGVDILHNYDIQRTLGGFTAPPNGLYTYGTIYGFIADLASSNRTGCFNTTTGAAQACYTNYKQTTGRPNFDVRTVDWGFFAQDDWKALPNLTLNLGIRYDYEQLPKPILVNSAYPGTANMPSDKNNISPRLGFAYDPFGKGKSVIRGGFGLYYGHITNALLLTTRITNGAVGGQTAYTIAPSATAPRIPTTPTSFTASSALPDVQYLDKNLANPYSEQFDLAIQQDLGHGNVFQVAYLGSLGRQLPNSLNLNLNPSATYTVNYTVGGTSNCGPIACGTTFPVTVYAGSTVGGTSTLLNTGVNAAYSAISNINSSFHAMTVEFQNRGGKYFSYDLNYTWSHAHDYAQFSVTGLGSNNWFDPYANPGSNYGNSFLNVPHRVVGWAIFNIPGPRSGIMKYLAGGWSIKPALQAQSGLPYTATINSFTPPSQCAASTCYKSFTSGLSGTGVTYIPYIGRNTFRYSPDLLVDMRAQKDFHITERMRFELVAESFNLLNYQNITGVNTQAYSVSGSTLTYNTSFQAVQNVNNNFAYGPRTLQVGGRLFF